MITNILDTPRTVTLQISSTAPKLQRITRELLIKPDNLQAGHLIDLETILVDEADLQSFTTLIENRLPISKRLYKALLENGQGNPDELLTRLTANILGGGLITGGDEKVSLDGMDPIVNYSVWLHLVQNKTINDVFTLEVKDDLTNGLTQLLQYCQKAELLYKNCASSSVLYDTAMDYLKQAQKLKVGEKLRIHGGFANKGAAGGAHALIFEFHRVSPSHYDLSAFSSTEFAGLIDSVDRDDRKLQTCVVPFCNIPEEWLFFGLKSEASPLLIKCLLELRSTGAQEGNCSLKIQSLKRLFDYLETFRDKTFARVRGDLFVTGQRAGTCAPSATKVWMQHLYSKIFKELLFDLEWDLLLDFFALKQNQLPDASRTACIDRRMIVYAAQNLWRRIAKRAKSCPTALQELDNVRVSAHALLTHVKKATKVAAQASQQNGIPSDVFSHNSQSLTEDTQRIFKIQSVTQLYSYKETPPVHQLPNLIPITAKDTAELIQVLQSRLLQLSLADKKTTTQQKLLITGIHHLVDALPLPGTANYERLIDRATSQQLETLLEIIMQTATLYCSGEHYKHDLLPRRFATGLVQYVLTHCIAIKLDVNGFPKGTSPEALLSSYQTIDIVKNLASEELLYLERHEWEKIEASLAYVHAHNSQATQQPLFAVHKNTDIAKWVIDECPANGVYWEALTRTLPSLGELALAKGSALFPDLSHKEIENDLKQQEEALATWLVNHDKLAANSKTYTEIEEQIGKKPEPTRKVNLSSHTKMLLALEEIDSNGSILKNTPHIEHFRTISFLVKELMTATTSNFNKKITITRSNHKVDAVTRNFNVIHSDLRNALSCQQRSLASDHKNWFSKCQTTSRLDFTWKPGSAEGKALLKPLAPEGLLRRIERTLAHSQIMPLQLFYELENEPQALYDPSLQSALLRLLCRSPIDKTGHSQLGLGELICHSPALQEKAAKSLRSALSLLMQMRDSFKAASFCFEVAVHVHSYLKQANYNIQFFDLTHEAQDWLKKEGLSEHDQAMLHHYLALFAALSGNDAETIFKHYLFYCREKWADSSWLSPGLQAKSFALINQAIARLDEATAVKLGQALSATHIPTADRGSDSWSIQNALPLLTNGSWTIDLLEGKLYGPAGVITGVDPTLPWEKNVNFKRVFRFSEKLRYQALGSRCVHFSHEKLGACRLLEKYSDFIIQAQLPGTDAWNECLKPDGLRSLPQALVCDHAVWYCNGHNTTLGRITDLKKHELRYTIDHKGKITDISKEGYTVTHLHNSDKKLAALERFDALKNTLVYERAGILEELLFPRYSNFEGGLLRFIKTDKGLAWSENRQYVIPDPTPQGLLGSIDNYLYLASTEETGQGMLILPVQAMASTPPHSPALEACLNIKNTTPFTNSITNEFWGTQRYVALAYAEGELQPGTQAEAALFLAYLEFLQKNYTTSIFWLKQPFVRQLSLANALPLLHTLQKGPVHEDHPDAMLVLLHASSLQLKLLAERHKALALPFVVTTAESFQKLLQSKQNATERCLLNNADEQVLLQTVLSLLLKIDFKDRCHIDLKRLEERLRRLQGLPIEPAKIISGNPIQEGRDWDHVFWTYKPSDTDWLKRKDFKVSNGEKIVRNHPTAVAPADAELPKKLFGAIYAIAKQGSPTARAKLLYCVRNWALDAPSQKHWYTLLAALAYPEKFPEIPLDPNFWDDPKAKYDFLCEVENGANHLESDQKRAAFNALQLPQPPAREVLPASITNKAPEPILSKPFSHQDRLQLDFDALEPLHTAWNNQLKNWRQRFITERPATVTLEKNPLRFEYREDLLSEAEQVHKPALQNELALLQAEAEKVPLPVLPQRSIDANNLISFRNEVALKLANVEQEKRRCQALLLKKANRLSSDPVERLQELSSLAGGTKTAIDLSQCIYAALHVNYHAFQKLNPHLDSTPVVDEVVSLLLQQAHFSITEKQLKRMLVLLDKIAKTPHNQLYQQLIEEIQARHNFYGFENWQRLVFMLYASVEGLIPRPDQLAPLRKALKAKDLVFQLGMGKGKTRVIAALYFLLKLASGQESIPLMIVPPALFDTIRANLSATLSLFGIELHALNLPRQTLTLDFLKTLQKQQQTNGKSGQLATPLLLTAPTLQGLDLEFLSCSRKIAKLIIKQRSVTNTTDAEAIKQMLAEINAQLAHLQEKSQVIDLTLLEFETRGHALLEEVDQLLNAFLELVFVDGELQKLSAADNELLRGMFAILCNRTFGDKIGLRRNRQAQLTAQDYEMLIPKIAEQLAIDFKSIACHIGETFRDSFVRYTTGKMPFQLQRFADDENLILTLEEANTFPKADFAQFQEDIAFLRYLRKLHKNSMSSEAAYQIALTKSILTELLQRCLAKSSERNYGPSPRPAEEGKVIPFEGVKTPASTDFGHHDEAATFQYQQGLNAPPDTTAIGALAKLWTEMADTFVAESGKSFDQSPEYEEFFETYGVPLDKISEPGNLEKAAAFVAENPSQLLDMQYDLAMQHVSMCTELLSSNGLDLLDHVDTRIAMSGTTWDVEGYSEPLARSFIPENTAEIELFKALAEKFGVNSIIEMDFDSIQGDFHAFLELIYALHENPDLAVAMIDVDGIFKDFGVSSQIAENWMAFLSQKNPAIEAVLYFGIDPLAAEEIAEGQLPQPNTLYAYRKDSGHLKIGSSTPEALRAKGLVPANYAVYFDEKHTTGADMALIEACDAFVTYGRNSRRDWAQGAERCRKIRIGHKNTLIIDKKVRAGLINAGRSFNDLLLNATKVQVVRKDDAMERYFIRQVQHVARKQAVQLIRQKARAGCFDDTFVTTVQSAEPFFVTYVQNQSFEQHYRLNEMGDAKEVLKARLNRQLQHFEASALENDAKERVKASSQQLSRWIDEAKCLPSHIRCHADDGIIGNQVQREVAITVERAVEVTIAREIEVELQRYMALPNPVVKPEKGLTLEEFLALVAGNEQISLQSQLKSYPYEYGGQAVDYSSLFAQPIFGTYAYFNSCENQLALPIFHQAQRPPKQILAVEIEPSKLRYLMLSEDETQAAAKYLEQLYGMRDQRVAHCHLLQLDGSPFVKPPVEIEQSESFRQALIEINALAGNMAYLNKTHQRALAQDWLDSDTSLKVTFLQLRALSLKDPLQKKQLLTSAPIAVALGHELHIPGIKGALCKKRLAYELKQQGYFRPKIQWHTKLLTAKQQISRLHSDYVPMLGLLWEKRHSCGDTRTALETIRNQVSSEEALCKLAKKRTTLQLGWLTAEQVPFLTTEQVPYLPSHNVQHLNKLEQIGQLRAKQVKGLVEKQKQLLKHLPIPVIKHLDQVWQIENLPSDRVCHSNPTYWCYLTAEQINELQLDLFTEPQINQLLESLTPKQIKGLHHPELILRIEKPEQIEFLLKEKRIDPAVAAAKYWLIAENQKGLDELRVGTRILECANTLKQRLAKQESPVHTYLTSVPNNRWEAFNKLKEQCISNEQLFFFSNFAQKNMSLAIPIEKIDEAYRKAVWDWQTGYIKAAGIRGGGVGAAIGAMTGKLPAAGLIGLGFGAILGGVNTLLTAGARYTDPLLDDEKLAKLVESVRKTLEQPLAQTLPMKNIASGIDGDTVVTSSLMLELFFHHREQRLQASVNLRGNYLYKDLTDNLHPKWFNDPIIETKNANRINGVVKSLFTCRIEVKLPSLITEVTVNEDSFLRGAELDSIVNHQPVQRVMRQVMLVKDYLDEYVSYVNGLRENQIDRSNKWPIILGGNNAWVRLEDVFELPMLPFPKLWLAPDDYKKIENCNRLLKVLGKKPLDNSYSFKRDRTQQSYVLKLSMQSELADEPFVYTLATFDHTTVSCYSPILFQGNEAQLQAPQLGLFLLEALLPSALPGNGTRKLKKGAYLPVLNNFEGLLNLLESQPGKSVHYNCHAHPVCERLDCERTGNLEAFEQKLVGLLQQNDLFQSYATNYQILKAHTEALTGKLKQKIKTHLLNPLPSPEKLLISCVFPRYAAVQSLPQILNS